MSQSTWGDAWGALWGDSWGEVTPTVEPVGGGRRVEWEEIFPDRKKPREYEPLTKAERDALYPPKPKPAVVAKVAAVQTADPGLPPAVLAAFLDWMDNE